MFNVLQKKMALASISAISFTTPSRYLGDMIMKENNCNYRDSLNYTKRYGVGTSMH